LLKIQRNHFHHQNRIRFCTTGQVFKVGTPYPFNFNYFFNYFFYFFFTIIFTNFYLPTSDPLGSNLQQASGSIWIQADPKLTESSSAHFTLGIDEIAASAATTPQLRMRLREGYVGYNRSGFELIAGKIIIPWGKSDVVNPTDFLTAKDYSFFNPDEEVKRLGAIGVSLTWTPGKGDSPMSFTVVSIPVFV